MSESIGSADGEFLGVCNESDCTRPVSPGRTRKMYLKSEGESLGDGKPRGICEPHYWWNRILTSRWTATVCMAAGILFATQTVVEETGIGGGIKFAAFAFLGVLLAMIPVYGGLLLGHFAIVKVGGEPNGC